MVLTPCGALAPCLICQNAAVLSIHSFFLLFGVGGVAKGVVVAGVSVVEAGGGAVVVGVGVTAVMAGVKALAYLEAGAGASVAMARGAGARNLRISLMMSAGSLGFFVHLV
jgi:hypothetical protein